VTLIDDGVGDTTTTGATEGVAPRGLQDAADRPAAGDAESTGRAGGMRVRKRNGTLEPVDVNKIVNAIARASEGLLGVDPMRVPARESSTSCRSGRRPV
jgi:ribonucleoside-diphosphate reductase alpha chain